MSIKTCNFDHHFQKTPPLRDFLNKLSTQMRKFFIVLIVVFTATFAQSQSKWDLGLQLGGMGYQGDLNPNPYMDFNTLQFGYGAFLRRNFNQNLGLRLNYAGGKVKGDDLNWSDERKARGYNFSNSINELGLLLEWDILGHRRYREDGTFRKVLSPYLFGGVAGAFTGEAKVNYNDPAFPNRPNMAGEEVDIKADKPTASLAVPFGLGLRYDLNERWNLGAEFGLRPVFQDYLDGVSESGDAANDDWYSFANLTLTYRFLPNDRDKDGVSDKKDACPDEAGLVQFAGCPDKDGDGIIDKNDACVDVPGLVEFNGCPDLDKDGIPDKDDSCPDVFGLASMKGCPDADGDGITDADDKCPNVKGIASMKGCPDSDGDGITDADDKCPNVKGIASMKGCPDTDGDGITDADDKCPTVAGTVANNGCPEIKVEEKAALDLAVKNIQFETNSDNLKELSIPIINQVSDILAKYPNYNVNITAHTDNVGSDKFNMALSSRRATTCVKYLVGKGIDAKRLTSVGFGETMPIGDNKTVNGRQMNRRVEFELQLVK